jgi:alpha-tubulin suppressor-like RCC1 family protein
MGRGPRAALSRGVTPVHAAFSLLLLIQFVAVSGAPAANAATKPGAIVSLATGYNHSCVITSSQGVQCWGRNDSGQVGDGTFTNELTPVDVIGLAGPVIAIDGGGQGHTCAIISGGAVQCWGRNRNGQLGDGSLTNSATPVNVVGLPGPATAITTGGDHTCALINTGAMLCWGRNDSGQLGNGNMVDSSTPVNVVGLGSGVTAVDAGGNHTCAIVSGGDLKCWGANGFGQVGDGTTVDRTTPVDVSGMTSGVLGVSNGGQASACAVDSSHAAKCWGNNKYGQLGDGTTTNRVTPVQVSDLTSGVKALSAGGAGQICALMTSSGIKCWGRNDFGQIGDGTTTQRPTPVDVSGLSSGVGSVATGGNHTCALMVVRSVKCWGNNAFGAVGDGTLANRSTPVEVIDPVPPTTTIVPTPSSPDGHGGSYASAVHLGIGDVDDAGGSGVAETRCVIDPPSAPSSFSAMDASCPLAGAGIDVTAPGPHVVYGASIDAAGNDESPTSFAFRIGHRLSVSVDDAPTGGSRVTSTPDGIDCGGTCAADFDEQDVVLTATPGPGLVFAGWGGDCSGTGGCTVSVSQDRSVTARFVAPDVVPPTTSISRSPSSPDGNDGSYATSVHLAVSAVDEPGGSGVAETRCVLDPASAPASFDDLPAGCAYTGSGLDVTAPGQHVLYAASADAAGNRSSVVSSSFRIGHALSASVNDVAGNGSRVSSSPAGIDCASGASCTAQFAETDVTLTASAGPGRAFTGWEGDCTGSGPCVVSMTQDRSVTADFDRAPDTTAPTTTIAPTPASPDGHGGSYAASAHLSVSAADDSGGSGVAETRCVLDPATAPTRFADLPTGCPYAGAGGDVSTAGRHVVYGASIDAAGNAGSPTSFSFRIGHTLTVSVTDAGSGGSRVTSAPAGISCPTTCSKDFTESNVTLTATPGPGLVFSGWSGACSGTGGCTVSMIQDQGVVARFSAAPVNLVGNPGFETGATGWVSSTPAKVALGRVSPGHSGSWAGQLTNNSSGKVTCTLDDSPNWVRTSAAGTYTASLWFRTSRVGTSFELRMRELVGSKVVKSKTVTLTANGSWQQISMTFSPSSPGSSLDLNAMMASPKGPCFTVDDVSVTKS